MEEINTKIQVPEGQFDVVALKFDLNDKTYFAEFYRNWRKLCDESIKIGGTRQINTPEAMSEGIFCMMTGAIKVLNKNPQWRAKIIGDEKREKIKLSHKNADILGFKKHEDVIKIFKKSSIAVACSRWEEPFGRTSLEASANGCAVIITNRGGLPETVTNAKILKGLTI